MTASQPEVVLSGHLPRPRSSTPVLLRRELRPDTNTAALSRYGDEVWRLDQSIFEENAKTITVNFTSLPPPWRDTAKRYLWVLINTEPPTQLRRMRPARLSLQGIRMLWFPLKRFFQWLHAHRVTSLSMVSPELLDDYLAFLTGSGDPLAHVYSCVGEVRRLWGHRMVLPEAMRLPETPPWDGDCTGVLLGKVRPSAENRTPRIDEHTMQPLLLWALRFVEEFADDIITAQHELLFLHARGVKATRGRTRQEPRLPAGGPIQIVADYARSLRDSDALIPGRVTKTGERVIDFAHVGRLVGIPLLAKASYTQAQAVLLQSGLPVDDDAYLSTPITATIGSQPWHPGLVAYRRAWQLVRHLHTACLIVVAYLSGARPAEVLNLRRGCITRDETTDLYLMSGVYFKSAVDKDGDKEPEGLQRRDPWVVVAPVAQAVAVLERLHNEELLFTHRTDPTRNYVTRRAGGAARNSQVVTNDIHRFITYVNQLCAHHQVGGIPSDSHGALTITRFRRTLAWFIRRRPRGLVAASIQYGHMHTRMIQGYAGAYDSGFPDELAFEEFLSRLEQFAEDEQALDTGEYVSGPAARTYLHRVRIGNERFAGHVVTTTRQARDLLSNPLLQIHHGEAMTCVFDATKAACQLRGHRDDPMVTPDIDDCQPNCRNLARTERDIVAIRRYRARLADTVKDAAAPPIRHHRELQELERIDALIKDHDERT